jgi:hypothetical protein
MIDFSGEAVHAQINLQLIVRLQTLRSEVDRVLASIYETNHKSHASTDQSTVFLRAVYAFMHVIVLVLYYEIT